MAGSGEHWQEHETSLKSVDGLVLDARLIEVKHSVTSVLLVHGFGVDLHEEGTFDVLATRLAEAKVSVARFSFRGHGKSAGTQEGMTISGERLDLTAAYNWMTRRLSPPYAILAASFGAVSTLLQLRSIHSKPARLVLWNPVLDLDAVFVAPTTVWGKKNFGKSALAKATSQGYSIVDGSIRVGQVFLEETALYSGNLGVLALSSVPTLVLHGTDDSYVPIASSRQVADMPNVRLVEIRDSDHGFPDTASEETAITEAVRWLTTTAPDAP
ncbi:MAG: alpha/beta fold hydrolase [Phycisphaeraceae bacterium]|nr:alpha/beta fold hydrolase [Phycisphaeraceae bacterium]